MLKDFWFSHVSKDMLLLKLIVCGVSVKFHFLSYGYLIDLKIFTEETIDFWLDCSGGCVINNTIYGPPFQSSLFFYTFTNTALSH